MPITNLPPQKKTTIRLSQFIRALPVKREVKLQSESAGRSEEESRAGQLKQMFSR